MKPSAIARGCTAVLLAVLTAACGTLVFPSANPGPTPAPDRDRVGRVQRANALAAYSMAVVKRSEGDVEAALRFFEEAARLDPENLTLQFDLAVAYLQQQRLDDMQALLGEVLTRDPDSVRALGLQAVGYRLAGTPHRALAPLAKAARLEPTELGHPLELAALHAATGSFASATAVLEAALPTVTNQLIAWQAIAELNLREAARARKADPEAILPEAPLRKIAAAAESFPDDPVLLSLQGDLLILHRRIEEAVDIFARVETLQPEDPDTRSRLVYSLLALGDRDRAVALLEEIAARRPDQHRIWFYIAALHEQDEATDLADAAYAKAIEIRPDDPESYLKRAFLLLAADRPADAESVLRAAVSQVPNDPRIDEMTGYCRLALDDAAGAVEAFARADRAMTRRNTPPALTHFHLNYALALTDLGQVGEAARQLRIAVRADPDTIERYMSRIFRDRRDSDTLATALLVLDRMDEAVPRNTATYTLYGMIAYYAEDYAAALTLFERAEQFALEAGEDEDLNETFFFWLGAAAERTKDYDKAETAFLDAIARRPDYADAHNYLAYMHAERGVKLEMAYHHVGVALAVEPENPAFIDTRGWIYYQMGRYEEALVDIEAAIALLPDDPTIADHLGDIHLKLGNPAEALRWWNASLAADPDQEAVAEKIRAHQPADAPPPLSPAHGSETIAP